MSFLFSRNNFPYLIDAQKGTFNHIMKQRISQLLQNDLQKWHFFLICAGILVFRLLLTGAQQVFLYPDESGMDDMLMYNMAVSITNGEWLGAYNFLTLAKHSFFALWLASLHVLGIPYLLGGQILWSAACVVMVWALAPIVQRRLWQLFLLSALLFNPAAVANPEPFAFVTRVYRDNIFPALCLLCLAGLCGAALRYREPLRRSVGWLLLCGVFWAAVWLTREDGIWLVPFLFVGLVVTAVFILRAALPQKPLRLLCLLLPAVVLAAGLAAWSGMNYHYYGRFIISDFSANEFADAYGALTRVGPEHWHPEYAVPIEVRRELYDLSPSFAILEDYLEDPGIRERYGDHRSGGFYWALREAAAANGFYDSPELAKAYFTQLANEINGLCDAGLVSSRAARSSVTPPLDLRFVPPVAQEWVKNLLFCVTFQDCEPTSLVSIGEYESQLAPMEDYLHEEVLLAYRENSELPYYSLWQRACFFILEAIAWVYRIAIPVMLLCATAWQALAARATFKRKDEKENGDEKRLVWLLMLGLLFLFLLRAAMIAFTSVSSFQIGIYVMYLATVHPIMILYACLGTGFLVKDLQKGGQFAHFLDRKRKLAHED